MNFVEAGCPCSEPRSFEQVLGIEAGVDVGCVCDPRVCGGAESVPDAVDSVLYRAGLSALLMALRSGVRVSPEPPRPPVRGAKQRVQVLRLSVAAYLEDEDVDGAAVAAVELAKALRRVAELKARPMGVPVWVSEDLLANIAGPESTGEDSSDGCCREALADGAFGPVRFVGPIVRPGRCEWQVSLVLRAPHGVVEVGPVVLEVI